MEIVCQCIKKWERLCHDGIDAVKSTVDIPYQTLPWRNPNHVMDLSNALCEAKPLRTITLVEPQFDIPLLRCLARPPSLEAIHIGPRPVREHGDYHKRRSQATKALLMKEERLRTLIHYDYDIDDIGHDEEMACVEGAAPTDQQPKLYSFDSSFVALRSVSDTVKSEIYSNIIFFSLLTTHKKEAFYSGLGITSEHSNKVPKLNILLVSKQFHTMAMRHYYRHCLINGLSQLWRVESHLSDHPPLGSAIRSLITRSCESGAVAEFRPIVSCATNLVHLIYIKHLQDKRTPMLDYKGLTTLAQNVGSTLQTLTGHLIARPTAAKPPTPLYAFVALRSLDWETPTQLKFKREEVPPGALACLENLSFVSVNDTFLQLLGCMTLPALRNVSFPVAKKMPGAHEFLKIHGKKLNTLSAEDVQGFWALYCPDCPTLSRELHVKAELQDLGLLDFGMEYPALKEIQASKFPDLRVETTDFSDMSSGHLPDEIIREILFPALRVPDEIFRSSEAVSPFSNYSESTSAFLVVCKSWLRVATPLLYSIVVLRSKPQAQALERALRGNSLLGTFINKLRVEGGLGSSMYNVLRLAPNMEELWLSLHIWSSDSVSGLCRGLPLANPRRLILYDDQHPFSTNAASRQLLDILCQCIKKWERLSIVDLPFHSVPWRQPNSVVDICDALSKAAPLRTITLFEPQYHTEFLKRVAKNPFLETVRIGPRLIRQHIGYFGRRSREKKEEFMADKRLKMVLRYDYDIDDIGLDEDMDSEQDDDPAEATSANFELDSYALDPSFVALSSVSDVAIKKEIWSNIIYFSLLTTNKQETHYAQLGVTSEHGDKVLRLNILLVSKQFYNIAMHHFYRYRLISGARELWTISEHLSDNPALGSAIHSLVTLSCEHGSVADFRPIITSATNLVHLISKKDYDKATPLLDYKGLATLAANAGPTLQTLTGHLIARPSTAKPSTPLYAFAALRFLDWETPAQLKFKPEEVPSGALARLENLRFISTNDTFLQLLGSMTLPALRSVCFPAAKKMPGAHEFLKIHGKKLVTLNAEDVKGFWTLCPSLRDVHISGRPAFGAHKNVETITLTKIIT
ncbi:hypothetical protein DXG01_011105 [Tephrocybe rancida]|nr:hypothetical protein DXG01_011105 [Tephrocybe rancida]